MRQNLNPYLEIIYIGFSRAEEGGSEGDFSFFFFFLVLWIFKIYFLIEG